MQRVPENELRARGLMAEFVPANLMRGWVNRKRLRVRSPSDATIEYLYIPNERVRICYNGVYVSEFCIGRNYQGTGCPESDVALTVYLSIRFNEDAWLATGNFYSGEYYTGVKLNPEQLSKMRALKQRQDEIRRRGVTMDSYVLSDRYKRAHTPPAPPPPPRPPLHGSVWGDHVRTAASGNTITITLTVAANTATSGIQFAFPLARGISFALDGEGCLLHTGDT